MIISDLSSSNNGDRHQVSAILKWEDADRADDKIFFETHNSYKDDLCVNPNSFLLAGAIPAMHYQEKRIRIDEEVCPGLLDGLKTAMHWINFWFTPEAAIPIIEAKRQNECAADPPKRRAGMFLSGGIDSLSTIIWNRKTVPRNHPLSIKDAFIICGLELEREECFGYIFEETKKLAKLYDLPLIPVYSNHYLIYRKEDAACNYLFWNNKFMGAALSAVAHAFRKRTDYFYIASADDIPSITPYGSHPLLEVNFSSHDLRIIYDGVRFSRLDKIRIVAQAKDALQLLRVCNQSHLYRNGRLNCGCCEKCIITMLEFAAVGVLDKVAAFPHKAVTCDMLSKICKVTEDNMMYYHELIPALEKAGLTDLAKIISKSLSKCEKKNKHRGLKEVLRLK